MAGDKSGLRFWPVLPALTFLSYAVMTFEVALTRIFSVVLNYHFVFAIVSAALLGLGLGAVLTRRRPPVVSLAPVRIGAILFAVLPVVSVAAIVGLPVIESGGFWLYLILSILPFGAAGFAISGIFRTFAARSAFLYGADLLGAAVGALTVIPLLDAFGGVNAAFFAAAIAAAGALILGFSAKRFPVLAAGVFLAAAAVFGVVAGSGIRLSVPVANDPEKDMYQMLANPAFKSKIVESRWSSFGRTDLISSERFPNEMTLYLDGAAGSAMYNAAALLKDQHELQHITLHFGEFFPFLSLKEEQKNNALIIGPGGGRDVVVAVLGGVKSITAVEVNPDIVQIVKKYSAYNGGIYTDNPRVTPVVAEGRNFVRRSSEHWDLIMLSLPVTKSLRTVEGFALTENYLFTVEAFQDYLAHLSDQGRIIIVAHADLELYKLISIATAAFARQGIPETEAMKRIYTVASDMMPAIVIQKQPLTPDEAGGIHESMHALGFDKGAWYVPYQKQEVVPAGARLGVDKELRMFDQFLLDVSEGKLRMETLVRTASRDIRPVTDDRPFYYKFDRGLPSPFGAFAVLIAGGLAVLGYLILLRKKSASKPSTFVGAIRESLTLKRFLLVFSTLGAAYMLIEIALFQKLILYFGQPQAAFTALLFSLLLGGGAGSVASSRLKAHSAAAAGFVSIGITLAVALASQVFPGLLGLGLPPRVASAVLLIPLGFLLGFPFPLAIRLMDAHGLASHVPVMWGVNGIASVLGSALSMIVGISLGFSWALFLGGGLYILVAAMFLRMPALPTRLSGTVVGARVASGNGRRIHAPVASARS